MAAAAAASQEDSKSNEMETENEDEEETPQDILLIAAEMRFKLKSQRDVGDDDGALATQKELWAFIKEHTMIAFYKAIVKENGMVRDESLLAEMEATKQAKLDKFAEQKEAAEKQSGETEVHAVQLERAAYLGYTSTLSIAIAALESIDKLTSGKKMDGHLRIQRLCLAWRDDYRYKKYLPTTTKLINEGGDWDRRNRFTVYNGIHFYRIRDFNRSARCFLDAIATFTATEIFSYKELVKFTIISAVVSLPRTMIKEKLIDSPEIRQVILEIPVFKEFLYSFYECRYGDFFKTLVKIMDFIRSNGYLHVHAGFYLREMRCRTYGQFLKSYLSVKLASMASEFDINEPFLDEELSEFISTGKLNCKMNRVTGVVEMRRVDDKSARFADMIKKGDLLMNRVQRLSRVIT